MFKTSLEGIEGLLISCLLLLVICLSWEDCNIVEHIVLNMQKFPGSILAIPKKSFKISLPQILESHYQLVFMVLNQLDLNSCAL